MGRPSNKLVLICKHCSKEFMVPQCRKNAKYCKAKCKFSNIEYLDLRSKLQIGREPGNKKPTIIKNCETCGKVFNVKNYRKDTAKFCSRKCTANREKTDIFVELQRTIKINSNYRGEKHWNWKGGTTKFSEALRRTRKYKNWRTSVYNRDGYICQECGSKGGKLHCHHIKELSAILEKFNINNYRKALNCDILWDINNGLTLCTECHRRTPNYGTLANRK